MDDGQIDDVAEAVIGAFHAGDRDALRLLLHPYLHWTDAGGRRIRGRTKVLNLLDGAVSHCAACRG